MVDFEDCVSRYGEFGVQAIIEGLERREGIPIKIGSPLEERWNALINSQPAQSRSGAAA